MTVRDTGSMSITSPVVSADNGPRSASRTWPGELPSWLRKKLPCVAVGYETDLVAVRLGGLGQAAVGRFLAQLVLDRVAEQEHGQDQLLAGQSAST
jgi:hypothetical protein